MTLLFMDGFDHYATADMLKKWTTKEVSYANISGSYSRFDGQGLSFTHNLGYISKTLSSTYSSMIFGFAFRTSGSIGNTTSDILYVHDRVTTQLAVRINQDRTLSVLQSTNVLCTSTEMIPADTWVYLEFKALIHDSAGTVELRMDGTTICSASGADTQTTANAYIGGMTFKRPNDAGAFLDDLYVCDTQGTTNNDFLGDVRIATVLPNAAGTHTDFTPSAGANYENVDDATDIDDDATYNSSATATDKDSYNLAAVPNVGTVHGIQVNSTICKTDAGTRIVKPFVRTNATDYPQGSNVSLNSSYTMSRNIVELNPADSAAWEQADLDALEVGLEIIS